MNDALKVSFGISSLFGIGGRGEIGRRATLRSLFPHGNGSSNLLDRTKM